MVIAADAQGPEVVKQWVEEKDFQTLVDRNNLLGKLLNVKFVPYIIPVDEKGRLCRGIAGFDIQEANLRDDLETWAATGMIPKAWHEAEGKKVPSWNLTPDGREADDRYQRAVKLLDDGDREEAIAELYAAFRRDPQNWIIRKQLWAVEHPEAFYKGPVDYDWQRRRQQEEDKNVERIS